ncbi:unknown [Oscillibacter sp. CAG:155]|nr:unknown [Oscillibacter sp. CAG:155]
MLPLHHRHSQIGNRGGQGQHFADLELVNVIAGVQCQQLLGRQAVILRDLGPGVACGHSVGDFGGLGTVEHLRQISQVHHLRGGDVFLLDFHILGKLAGDGVFIGGCGLELLQQFFQRAGVGRGADPLTVDIQAVSGRHQTDLIGELLFKGLLIRYFLPAHQPGGILNGGILNGISLTQGLGGDLFQVLPGRFRRCPGIHRAHHFTVIGDGGTDGVKRAEHRDGGYGAARAQEGHGMDLIPSQPRPGLCHQAAVSLPAAQHGLPQAAAQHGHQAPCKQQQLYRLLLRLREPLGLFLPDNVAPAAPGPFPVFRNRMI